MAIKESRCAIAFAKKEGVIVIRYTYRIINDGIVYYVPADSDRTHFIYDTKEKLLQINNDDVVKVIKIVEEDKPKVRTVTTTGTHVPNTIARDDNIYTTKITC